MKQVKAKYRLLHFRKILPHYHIKVVSDIDEVELKRIGVRAIAFDADSTLVEHNHVIVRPEVIDFLKTLSIPVYVTTNRLAPRGDEVGKLINARAVIHATPSTRKPQRRYFKELEEIAGLPLHSIAMVGDRLFTDILGGNRVGMPTIFVDALGKDPWYMRLTGIRRFEVTLLSLLAAR